MVEPVDGTAFDAVLRFEHLVAPGNTGAAGRWVSGAAGLPYVEFTDAFDEFHRALGQGDWLQPFDWPAWLPEAKRLVEDPGLVDTADVETLRRLLTTHFRRDRFVEGHLLAMIENGHIAAVLRRMRALSQTREGVR